MHGCSCANRKVWITYSFAFYSFFRLLLFFSPFTLLSAFYPFFRFSAFYPFFRLLPFFPLFRLLPFFPLFRFSVFYPFFRFSAFYPFFRFSVSVFPFPRFTLTLYFIMKNFVSCHTIVILFLFFTRNDVIWGKIESILKIVLQWRTSTPPFQVEPFLREWL